MDVGNGWYLYSFFAGAGLELTMNADGSNSCNWNNATGLKVANKIKDIASSSAFISIGDTDAQASVKAKDELVAYVDGVWASESFKTGYGDGYSATKLPTFDLDGTATQMGSYAGYKLVGVNNYAKEKGWAMLLAEYITSEASQAKIGVAVNEAPANLEAAKAPELQANVALKGLAEQSPYSDRQVVGGAFWTPAGALGAGLVDGSHTDIQKALDDAVLGITQPVAQ
jgi:arabinogalactan oligomer/maltooligosaccharide transport system substrate-binding protein